MRRLWAVPVLAGVVALVLFACTGSSPTPAPPAGNDTPTPTPVGPPPPSLTSIPSPTAAPTPVEAPAPSPTPIPSLAAAPTPTLTPPPPAPTATPEPTPGPAFEPIPRAPRWDLAELVARLKLKSSTPVPPLPRVETSYAVGRVESFFVLDFSTLQHGTVEAVLRYVSPHAYFYVQEGRSASDEDLERSAQELEEQIILAIRRYVNPDWDPGAGIDSRITVLHARVRGVAGYVDSLDLYPTEIQAFSNQRPVVYISLSSAVPGTSYYYSVLAHEMQHAAHIQADPQEESWVQEGMSELLTELAGYPVGQYAAFTSRPDTQLTTWEDSNGAVRAHYGAAHLFLKYIGARYGYDQLHKLIGSQEPGVLGVEEFLEQVNAGGGFDAAFRDWTIANYLQAPPGSRFGYPETSIRVALSGTVTEPGTYQGEVRQYAADYVELRPGDAALRVTFQGDTTAPLIPTRPASGARLWWGNRGDQIDSTLTRRFDLSPVTEATLTFKLWHDIEEHFDYAYVEVSGDGGKTWDILPGRHTTDENRLGRSFGPAYTGISGGSGNARWVEESIDLGPYAGGQVLVRFEYVTDEGTNHTGLAIDDISIPEIGFFGDAEGEIAWDARGFVRTKNRVPQGFLVSFIVMGEEPAVVEMPLDEMNRGELVVPRGLAAVMVIGATAPVTTQAAQYSYIVEALPPPETS